MREGISNVVSVRDVACVNTNPNLTNNIIIIPPKEQVAGICALTINALSIKCIL